MKIGNLEATCQGSKGIYFSHYELYKTDTGVLSYNLDTGISEDFDSLEALTESLTANKSVIKIDYKGVERE